MNELNLYDFADRIAAEVNSRYTGVHYDRAQLVEFMDVNDWFGIVPSMRDKAPYVLVNEAEDIRESLILWLSAFKQSDEVKLRVLLEHFESEYPQTCQLYREFVDCEGLEYEAFSWKLLDYIFGNIGKEITMCNEEDIGRFVHLLDSDGSLAASRMFAGFIKYIKLTKWEYTFKSRPRFDVETGAYPLRDYAIMAYCVFNEDMWERNRLIDKAIHSVKYADMWLYTALHFLCALRSTDMSRLPAPQLPYEPEQVLSDIMNGTFPDYFAAALSDELKYRTDLKSMKPSKTSEYSAVPEIKLFIPESIRKPLGIIIAIALAKHSDIKAGTQFVFPNNYSHLYSKFFGLEFATAIGKRHLSIRRCNKSFLQGIETVTDKDDPGRPKGYILAALARSHKGGIGTLPEITDIYLKDANFTGYTPEFIAKEMFERGVFSFIPNALLEIYSGGDYKRLSVSRQTLLIKDVGLTSIAIENLLTAAESSLNKAKDTVAALIRNRALERVHIGAALQNIASGNAPARMSECLCLMSAVNERCPYPLRAGCLGCDYEIYTKSAIQLLMREFKRLSSRRSIAGQNEAWRYSALMNDIVVPAIAEIIHCAKSYGADMDVTPLLDIVERGLASYDRIA